MKKILPILFAGILSSLSIFLTGCDNFINLRGIAYEWVDAPANATSKIYITYPIYDEDIEPTLKKMIQDATENITVKPLNEVQVAISTKPTGAKIASDYPYKTTSNTTGEFEHHWVLGPVRDNYHVKASKPGYMEASSEAEFRWDTTRYLVVAILVKSDNQSPSLLTVLKVIGLWLLIVGSITFLIILKLKKRLSLRKLVTEKPLSIIIICGFLIYAGSINIIRYLIQPDSGLHWVVFIYSFIEVASGGAMLARLNWGRWLFVVSTLIFIIAEPLLNPKFLFPAAFERTEYFRSIIFGFLFNFLLLYFLFRPTASAYFKGRDRDYMMPSMAGPTDEVNVRHIVSIPLFGFSLLASGFTHMEILAVVTFGEIPLYLLIGILIGALIIIGFFVGGLIVWDWRRWRGVLGVFLCVLGVEMLGITSLAFDYITVWNEISGEPSESIFTTIYSSVTSVIIIVVGILAFIWQNRRDKASKNTLPLA